MVTPKVYADFHNADPQGRLRLNNAGSVEDLSRQRVTLREGMPLTLYSDDLNGAGQPDELIVDGIVSFSKDEQCWVASVDWSAVRHASERPPLSPDGTSDASEASAGGSGRAKRGR